MVSMVARTVFFTEYPQAFFALVRTHGRSLRGSCAALALLFFATAATVCGQSLVVTSGGSTVNQGTTISITTVPSMPNLVLSVNGGNSCDTVSYIVDVSYTDQAGNTTWAQYSAQNYAGDQPVTADWSGVLTGGSASVSWQFDGTSEGSTLGFFINGGNPPNSAVDAYASSGPWFVRNLIAWESRAWSLSPTGQYKQFDAFGYPLWGTPDGIGLMQLEPLYRISLDQDYWSWPTNVADGFESFLWIDPPDADYSPHAHDHDESLWVIDGEITFGAEGQELRLGPGDRLMLPKGTIHTARAGREGARYLIGERRD